MIGDYQSKELLDLISQNLENRKKFEKALDYIYRFTEGLIAKHVQHYPEKGDSWRTVNLTFLEDKLKEEIIEHFKVVTDPDELLDIGMMCAMLHFRLSEKNASL